MKLISLNEWCSMYESKRDPDKPTKQTVDNMFELLNSPDPKNIELGLIMAPSQLKDSPLGKKKLGAWFKKQLLSNKVITVDFKEIDGTDTIIIDCAGSVRIWSAFITDGKLNIKFNKVAGDFDCSQNNLISLEGCPETTGGYFNCSRNQLTSLDGCPQKVGMDFNCSHNDLSSLEGGPQEVGWNFDCSFNQIKSLKGGPQAVGMDFWCNHNQITSLDGAPEQIGLSFHCSNNQLTSLEGCPKKVGGEFTCLNNKKQFTEQDVRSTCDVHGLVRTT